MKVVPTTMAVLFCIFAQGAAAQPAPMDLAALLLQEQKWAEAERVLENIVSKEPGNAMAWMQLTRAYDGLGKFDRQIEAAQKA